MLHLPRATTETTLWSNYCRITVYLKPNSKLNKCLLAFFTFLCGFLRVQNSQDTTEGEGERLQVRFHTNQYNATIHKNYLRHYYKVLTLFSKCLQFTCLNS